MGRLTGPFMMRAGGLRPREFVRRYLWSTAVAAVERTVVTMIMELMPGGILGVQQAAPGAAAP